MLKTKIYNSFIKHKETILYLFFGGCTTLVNIVIYYLLAKQMKASIIWATALAWLGSVIFAYITNRKWVFGSNRKGMTNILKEFVAFLTCRIISGFFDVAFMWIFVEKCGLQDMVIKVVSNIVVIIMNYIVSKWFIFKKVRH